jgi:hypothetical protein
MLRLQKGLRQSHWLGSSYPYATPAYQLEHDSNFDLHMSIVRQLIEGDMM